MSDKPKPRPQVSPYDPAAVRRNSDAYKPGATAVNSPYNPRAVKPPTRKS